MLPGVTEYVVPLPAETVCDDGVAARLKSITDSETAAECERLPLVPVTVIVDVFGGVEPEVVTVSVEVPEPVIVDGLKFALAPAGNPPALSETVPLKPLSAPTFTVY